MELINPEKIIGALSWRYATKKFNPEKRIATDIWSALEEVLVLSPSSFGLQPWKFIVVTDSKLKAQLRPASWDQEQITSCSHLVVFCSKVDLGEPEIDAYVSRVAEVREQTTESLTGYKGMMYSSLVTGPLQPQINNWASRQVYIALGNFMTAAALMGVDTCPMEGFEPEKYNSILGVSDLGYSATVLCAAGYRADEDRYQSVKKVRFPKDLLIIK